MMHEILVNFLSGDVSFYQEIRDNEIRSLGFWMSLERARKVRDDLDREIKAAEARRVELAAEEMASYA